MPNNAKLSDNST